MTPQNQPTTVGPLSTTTQSTPALPKRLTQIVWLLWIGCLGVLVARIRLGETWELPGVVAVDGLTVVMWTVVTFFSGIVHSYSRRYLAGNKNQGAFFGRVFAFTLVVMVLVAADHIALFAISWLTMGLLMASLIGHNRGWPQAQAAARLSRRYFVASSGLLGIALVTLWWTTGESTVSGTLAAVETVPQTAWLLAAGSLLLAAMIQSALIPFHTWMLSSMTAPTPASALMHAGFVNAGGILLTRFGALLTVETGFMLLIVIIGALSALAGKLLKSVQADVKRKLGCSTVGQMGFMIMQAGLGFFGAAITHLILHGFYKAYQFLASGSRVEHAGPKSASKHATTPVGVVLTLLIAVAGGAVFAGLTGKGTSLDSSLLLTLVVVLTTLQAARETVHQTALPAMVRYGAVAVVFLPAIAIYAGVYTLIAGLLAGLPVVTLPTELTVVHGVVAGAFVLSYVGIERGVYQHSERLYAMLVTATQSPAETLLTSTEDYNEY